MSGPADDYLEKALEAEIRALETADPDIKARWLGIAFGYRELARYRREKALRDSGNASIVKQPSLADELAPASQASLQS